MGILGDYHTHTVYSHGKGTVEANVKGAIAAGLSEVGITDHGVCVYPNNMFPGEVKDFLHDVEECRKKYPQINIFAGVEANLLHTDGSIDITEKIDGQLDYIICGFHFVRFLNMNLKGVMSLFLPNMFKSQAKQSRIIKNTDAYVNAMERHRIAIIAHPLKGIRVDLKVLGEAAKEHNVQIEINTKNMVLTSADFETLVSTGCKLIVSSDAHLPENVGQVSAALAASRAAGIPDETFSNWNKFPDLNFNKKTVLDRERFEIE